MKEWRKHTALLERKIKFQLMNEIDNLLEKWHTLSPDEEEQFIHDCVDQYDKKSDEEKALFLNEFKAGALNACNEAEELIELLNNA